MKFSALHQSSGLTATVKFPDGTLVNLSFPRGKRSIPIHGEIGGINFESTVELVDRGTEDPHDEVDMVVVMALPSKIKVTHPAREVRPHAGKSTDVSSLPKEERSKSGLKHPETAVLVSPGNSDTDVRPVANQDFTSELPKPRVEPMKSVFATNPFDPPSAFVNKNDEGFKGTMFPEEGGSGLGPVGEKSAADGMTDEAVQTALSEDGLPPAPTAETDSGPSDAPKETSDKPEKKAQASKPQKGSKKS